MRLEEFDGDVTLLAQALQATGAAFLFLEDDDPSSVTVVAGPSTRNLERLARGLKRQRAKAAIPGMRKVDYDQLIHGGPSRWPFTVGELDVDIVIVDVNDGRWSQYYDVAQDQELAPGVTVGVVPDAPIIRARKGDATDVMPELWLSQRERDRRRMQRRRTLIKAERREARRDAARRIARLGRH